MIIISTQYKLVYALRSVDVHVSTMLECSWISFAKVFNESYSTNTNTKSLFDRPPTRTKLYKKQLFQQYNVKSVNYYSSQFCFLRLNA